MPKSIEKESEEMKTKKITIVRLIGFGILLMAIAAMLLVFPMGKIQNSLVSSSSAEPNLRTQSVVTGSTVLQEFVPTNDYLESIGILVNRLDQPDMQGTVHLVVADANFAVISESTMKISDMSDATYSYFSVEKEVTPGATYYYSVTTSDTAEVAPVLIYRRLLTTGPTENKQLFENGILVDGGSLVSAYTYQTPLRVSQIATYDSFILFLLLGVLTILKKTMNTKVMKKEIDIRTALGVISTVAGATVIGISGYYLLAKKIFGGTIWDTRIYILALICGSILLLLGIWKWKFSITLPPVSSLIRIMAFAFYFYKYTDYFNSGSDYGHSLAFAYMCIAVGVIMLTCLRKEEIFNKLNIAILFVYGLLYLVYVASKNFDLETRTLYLVMLFGIATWGLAILRFLIRMIKKEYTGKWASYSVFYVVAMISVFTLMLVFRNTRDWPIYLAGMFLLLYLLGAEEALTKKLFEDLCMGALGSFYILVAQSLLYRPYYNYNFSRYPGPFASVAVWGIYLLFVFCFAYAKTVIEFKRDHSLKNMFPWYVTFGVVMTYIILSVSRTAALGAFVILIVLSILMGWFWFRKNVKLLGYQLLCMCLSVMITFPVMYSLTRCVPAVVGEPKILNYEEFEGTIYPGEPVNSDKYMTFPHFMELYFGKMLTTFRAEESKVSVPVNKTSGEATSVTVPTGTEAQNPDVNVVVPETVNLLNDSDGEATNGRIEIFMTYWDRLNLTGHDAMVLEQGDKLLAHAHNTFLQSAYDHGVIFGVMFLLMGLISFLRSIVYFVRESEHNLYAVLPMIVVMAFAVAGMTEWVFHPSIPLTFALFFVQLPLLSKMKKK